MAFFAPYMLWGSLAAGIPIALHFLFRSRYRVVPWAAMNFLLQSIEQTSRRIRFQELLLLLARIGLLALLACALARPSSKARPGAAVGDAVDAVLLFDTSFSMDAREGTQTRLNSAKKTARELIDSLPPSSTVQIVSCSDRVSRLGPTQPVDREAAKQNVDRLAVSQLPTDFVPGFREAEGILDRGTSPNRELFLFSDMQKLGWDQQAGILPGLVRQIHDKSSVTLVRCGTQSPRNVAVVGIVPQSTLPHVGERVGFSVLIRNAGSEPIRDLIVTLTLDGDRNSAETQPIAIIQAGETRTVTLSGRWDTPGLRVVSAVVGPDDLSGDNRLDVIVPVRDQVRILVVDGAVNEREPEKSSSFFLMHALLPVKDADKSKFHIQPRLVTPALASAAQLGDKDLCILVNCPLEEDRNRRIEALSPEFCEALERFVRGGKPLLIFAGDRTNPDSYQRILGDRHRLLPSKITGRKDLPARSEVSIDRMSTRGSSYWKFRDDEVYSGLANVRASKYLTVEPTAEAETQSRDLTLLRFNDGAPVLVSKKVGLGEVVLVTTSADASWTDWPLWLGMYVPFIDMTVNRLILGAAQEHNGVCGQPIRLLVPQDKAASEFTLVRPDGRKVRLGPAEMVQGRPMVSATDTELAGVYRVQSADSVDEGIPFALAADVREGQDLSALTNQEIDDLLGFSPTHLLCGDEGASAASERLKKEWTIPLLFVVLTLALFEMGLAWWCGQAR